MTTNAIAPSNDRSSSSEYVSEQSRKRRAAIETQRQDETMRKERFRHWDDLEDRARERAESLSEAILQGDAEGAAAPAPSAPPAPARPKPSGLAIRLGLARPSS